MVTLNDVGAAMFRIYLPHADCVELVGDFTAWHSAPVVMRRETEGWWSADVQVSSGEHRFSYLVDGMYWMPDYAAHGVEHTDFGKWVSRLVVPAAGDGPARQAPRERAVPGRGLAEAPGVSVLRERGLLRLTPTEPGHAAVQ